MVNMVAVTTYLVVFYGQVLLAPVLIGIITARTPQLPRRTVLMLAAVGMSVLAAGVFSFDIGSGLRSLSAYYSAYQGKVPPNVANSGIYAATGAIAAGTALTVAASAIALSRSAHLRQWRWFSAILLMMIFSAVVIAGFSNGFPGLDVAVGLRLEAGDAPFSMGFYLVESVLVVLSPLATLLYGLRGPDERGSTTMPPEVPHI